MQTIIDEGYDNQQQGSGGGYTFPGKRWQQFGTPRAGLGCGSILLIIFIVLLFGNMGSKDVTNKIDQLRITIEQQNQALLSQSVEIQKLQTQIDNLEVAVQSLKQVQP